MRLAVGQVEWGGPHLAVGVLAGAVVYAQRIRCLPKGSDVAAFHPGADRDHRACNNDR